MQDFITIRQMFRTRPIVIGTLEEIAGSRCWFHQDDSISEFCRLLDLDAAALMGRLLELPPTPERSDWKSIPLYHLADHLTENHHHFRSHHLQAVQLIFDSPDFQSRAHAKILAPIHAEFESFKQNFLWHMDEEEGFLFPKALRTEACVRHGDLYPEVFKGSVRMYSSSQIHSPEETFKHMLESLIIRVRALVEGNVRASRIGEAIHSLKAFQSKLIVHIGLESEILFPRAIALEEHLKKRALDSAPQAVTIS